ncbi:MAG: 50S ribosomal protein L33 [Elusimicrobia bacterium]|nr:50S ribosomal protein L33 [Elusimicrobiota bacterium]
MAKVDSTTISLQCTQCKRKNYFFRRNKKKKYSKKLELKKYCSFCKKRTVHKEAKA